MATSSLFEEYGMLQEQLRVLILQYRSEEMDYDERFLQEVQSIAQKLLRLKQRLRSAKGQTFVWPLKGEKSGRFSRYQ